MFFSSISKFFFKIILSFLFLFPKLLLLLLFSLLKNHNFFDKKSKGRDPRFDNISGSLNLDSYQKNYGFLKEKKCNK